MQYIQLYENTSTKIRKQGYNRNKRRIKTADYKLFISSRREC